MFHQIIMTNQIGLDNRNTSDWFAPSKPHQGLTVRAQGKIMVAVMIWM